VAHVGAREWFSSPAREAATVYWSERVVVADVEVLDGGSLVWRCRVGDKIVWVPPLRVLPGTQIYRRGDRGRLVLPHDLAVELGLA
jgi:hypothetical protein